MRFVDSDAAQIGPAREPGHGVRPGDVVERGADEARVAGVECADAVARPGHVADAVKTCRSVWDIRAVSTANALDSDKGSRTGDFTDVMVIDANGREIPWPEVSRIGDEEMGRLMRQVVNRLYTFQVKADDLHFLAMMDRALAEAWRWDEPELDEIILSAIVSSRRRAEEGD